MIEISDEAIRYAKLGIHAMKIMGGLEIMSVRRDAGEILAFVISDGSEFLYKSEADCCSNSWVESVEVLNAFPGTVLETTVVDGPGVKSDNDWSTINNYFYKIRTDKGYCDIELRNESNGYYGGQLVLKERTSPKPHMSEPGFWTKQLSPAYHAYKERITND